MRAGRPQGFILIPVVLALTLIAAVAFLLNRESGINTSMAARGLQAEAGRYAAEAGLAQINAQTQARDCSGYTDVAGATFGSASLSATVNPQTGSPVTLAATATLADGTSSSLTRSNVNVHRSTLSTVTLHPGAAGLDTNIRAAQANLNFGTDVTMSAQAGQQRSLLQFDLSAIPATSVIQSAQLSLYRTNSGANTVTAYRLTRPWSEGTATWNNYDGVHPWATAGGDFDPASGVAIALSAAGFSTWNLTSLMTAWTAGTHPNAGILLVASGTGSSTFASSDEATNVLWRPQLEVTFRAPCGWTPPATVKTLAAVQDTWIDESGSGAANYGGSQSFTVTNGNKKGRGLVRFDLSSVPPGAHLSNATLRLWVGSFSPKSDSILTVNRAYDPWVEGTQNGSGSADGATWKTRDGSAPWSGGFGIYWGFGAGDPVSTSAISSAFSSGWVEWNVTTLAQQWVDGFIPNYGAGVMIDTSSAVIFNSREWTIYQPQLVITY